MNVQEILDNLAAAFGGHSQYSLNHVSDAIVGHINNQGLAGDPESLAAEAAAVLEDRYGFDADETDEAAVVIAHGIRRGLYLYGLSST